LKNFRANAVFRASQISSKVLNDKKYFNTVKKSGQLCFLEQAQSCSEILNDKKYIQYSEKYQSKLCFSEFHFPV